MSLRKVISERAVELREIETANLANVIIALFPQGRCVTFPLSANVARNRLAVLDRSVKVLVFGARYLLLMILSSGISVACFGVTGIVAHPKTTR